MDKKEFLEETREDVEQLLFDQNAEIGVLIKIILDGVKKGMATSEEVIKVIDEFADSLIAKSPEAALQFRKEVNEKVRDEYIKKNHEMD